MTKVWSIDTEYGWSGGLDKHESRWAPVLFCAVSADTGERHHFWRADPQLGEWLRDHKGDLFIAHNLSAEAKYIMRLGHTVPRTWFDTMTAFKYVTNAKPRPPYGLADALVAIGCPQLVFPDKKTMQTKLGDLDFDWNDHAFMGRVLGYCYTDCEASLELWRQLRDQVPAPLMQFWAQYELVASRMELRGVPLDVDAYHKIWNHREEICRTIKEDINRTAPIYADDGTEKKSEFFKWVDAQHIQWPVRRNKSGDDVRSWDKDALKEMESAHPFIGTLRQHKKTMKALTDRSFVVDDTCCRHYFDTNPFGTITGRNSPWGFLFAGPKWQRFLAVPPSPDHVLVNVDYTAQEIAIAAMLSGDPEMRAMYATPKPGDFHCAFAIAAGAAPYGATKETHRAIRNLYKTTALGLLYGQTFFGLAIRLGIPKERAKRIVRDHQRLFPRFWVWSDQNIDRVSHSGRAVTPLGWRAKVNGDGKDIRTWMNYPVQGGAADQMRLTAIYLDQQGVDLLAIVHDGFLMSCRRDQLANLHEAVCCACTQATEQICPGFPMKWDTSVYETRYADEDGQLMWDYVQQRLPQ